MLLSIVLFSLGGSSCWVAVSWGHQGNSRGPYGKNQAPPPISGSIKFATMEMIFKWALSELCISWQSYEKLSWTVQRSHPEFLTIPDIIHFYCFKLLSFRRNLLHRNWFGRTLKNAYLNLCTQFRDYFSTIILGWKQLKWQVWCAFKIQCMPVWIHKLLQISKLLIKL